jgi:Flp pilus assembly pilin Flp
MNPSSRLLAAIRRLAAEETAVSAVEFALLLPLILLLLAGTVDVNEALIVHRKLRHVSSTVSDLIAQRSDITATEASAILSGAATLLDPYDGTELDIVLSVLDVTSGTQVVAWSLAYQDSAEDSGDPAGFPAPAQLGEAGVQMIAVKVNYNFETLFSGYLEAIFGRSGYAMEDVMYERPRVGDEILLLPG